MSLATIHQGYLQYSLILISGRIGFKKDYALLKSKQKQCEMEMGHTQHLCRPLVSFNILQRFAEVDDKHTNYLRSTWRLCFLLDVFDMSKFFRYDTYCASPNSHCKIQIKHSKWVYLPMVFLFIAQDTQLRSGPREPSNLQPHLIPIFRSPIKQAVKVSPNLKASDFLSNNSQTLY